MSTEKILTIDDVAARFQVSVRTIYNWIEAGTITSPEKIGGATRWKESQLVYTPKPFENKPKKESKK